MARIIKKLPSISIIIDSYNFGQFLDEAVESVLNQTDTGSCVEIIFMDDGSTDDTKQRIKKYKDKINYIHKENGGQASALNAGFKASRGEIIFFLDSDDIFYPDKIKQVLDVYNKYNCHAVFNSLIAFGNGMIPGKSLTDYTLQFLNKVDKNLYKLNYNDSKSSFLFLAQTSGESFTRELFQKLYPIPELYRYSADLYLHVFALLYEDIYYLDEPLTKYRQHSQSYMNKNFEGDLKHKMSEINFIIDTINLLEKTHDIRALPLIKSLYNKIHYLRFNLEKFKGNKLEALNHLLKYKASPKTLRARTVTKAHYMFDLLTPEYLHKPLKSLYRALK